jgi:outer membrane protein TolC
MQGSRATRVLAVLLLGGACLPLTAPAAPAPPPAAAVAPTAPPPPPPPATAGSGDEISLAAFLAEVAAANLDYAAARFNVPIAEAQLTAARVSPNPQLTVGTSGRDLTDRAEQREPANNDAGIAQTIELGGKRGKRVAVARANLAQAAATLEDFFRTLRANAATAFVDALTKRRIAEEKQRSAATLDQLVDANRKRLEVGDIGEIDLTQSKVDAQQFRAEYLAARSDAQVAAIGLEQQLGRRIAPGAAGQAHALRQVVPVGSLEGPARSFDPAALLAAAVQHRPDVIAARHALESARASVQVAWAMAVPDANLSFTYQDNERSHNAIAPAPAFSSIGLSVGFSLPIFNRFRGELEAARQTAGQAEATLHGVELRAQVEVRQALARYQLANERAAQFQGGLLDDAAAVFKAKLFSYEHGASSLLDVLNAQRAEDDIRLAYLDALDERAKALIGVEQAAGTWNVDL